MSARAMSRPMFYTNPICPFAHRALMSIAEKGLTKEVDVTLIPLSLELKMFSASGSTASSIVWKDQGKSPEELMKIKEDYKLKINPTSGEVPSLEIDGKLRVCIASE
jgi:glutathionyl-hydroquinone reductase